MSELDRRADAAVLQPPIIKSGKQIPRVKRGNREERLIIFDTLGAWELGVGNSCRRLGVRERSAYFFRWVSHTTILLPVRRTPMI